MAIQGVSSLSHTAAPAAVCMHIFMWEFVCLYTYPARPAGSVPPLPRLGTAAEVNRLEVFLTNGPVDSQDTSFYSPIPASVVAIQSQQPKSF